MKGITVTLVCTLLLGIGAIAAACGEGEELTLEEFFQEFGAIDDEIVAGFEAAEADFPNAFEDPDQMRGYLGAQTEVMRDGLERERELDAPAEVEEASDEFLDAFADQLELADDLLERLEDVESPEELEQALEASLPAFEEVGGPLTTACLALEGIADENGIDVDLACE